MNPRKGIEQGIAGPSIRYKYATRIHVGWQVGKVCDAAHVQHNAMFALLTKQEVIAIHRQGGAFATRSDVFLTKIRYRNNASLNGNVIAVANLQRGVRELGLPV